MVLHTTMVQAVQIVHAGVQVGLSPLRIMILDKSSLIYYMSHSINDFYPHTFLPQSVNFFTLSTFLKLDQISRAWK